MYVCDLGGTLLIEDATISHNGVGNHYEGIYIDDADLGAEITVSRSTISDNGRSGIDARLREEATLTLVNSTVSGNLGDGEDAAIEIYGHGDEVFRLLNSTVTANDDVLGGPHVSNAITTIENSIVSGNDLADDWEIWVYDDGELFAGHSLLGEVVTTGGGTYLPYEGVNTTNDPKLGPLADNGGPTLTHLPLAGSPAINNGDPAFVEPPAIDQRGEPRVLQGRIDIGSVEVGAALANTGLDATPFALVAGLLGLLGVALVGIRLVRRRQD